MSERFYIGERPVTIGEQLELEAEESHHLAKVLRRRVGDAVRVFGAGREYNAVVRTIGPRSTVEIVGERPPIAPASISLHIALPWLKGGRTESVVQKLTELGVSQIAIYHAHHQVVRADAQKLHRLRRVAIEACKQCERADVPKIMEVQSLETLFELPICQDGTNICLAERCEGQRLSVLLASCLAQAVPSHEKRPACTIISGPEGGFARHELETASAHTLFASLGPRILRADTAPIVAATVALAVAKEL